MKIIAAIMDVTRLKFFRHGYVARKTKKCLVYDPRIIKVAECDFQKENDDERTKQIR